MLRARFGAPRAVGGRPGARRHVKRKEAEASLGRLVRPDSVCEKVDGLVGECERGDRSRLTTDRNRGAATRRRAGAEITGLVAGLIACKQEVK
jgi:hypothetical protein